MKCAHRTPIIAVVLASALGFVAGAAFGADVEALAKAAQNPIANMISLPFQNDTNFKVGPQNKTQNILNIQPVYPVDLNAEANLITRTIIPVISQPAFTRDTGRENGIGDIQFSAFYSPKKPTAGGWIWGAGLIAQFDTATDDRLGQGVWGLGPTAVALRSDGQWLSGALINNVWSVAKDDNRSSVNQMLVQPFINYNIPHIPGPLPDILAGHHRQLGGGQRTEVDRSPRAGHRADHALGSSAGESAGLGLLQRRAPGQRRDVAAAAAGAIPVSEMIAEIGSDSNFL